MLVVDLEDAVVSASVVLALVVRPSVKPTLPVGETQPLVDVPLGEFEPVVQLHGEFAAVVHLGPDRRCQRY